MDDKEFVLALLGDFGIEVAQSTAALVYDEVNTAEYIEETREQFRRYGLSLLEWKNGPASDSSDTGRDSTELQTPPV